MLSSVHSVNNVEIGCNDHESVRPITKPEIVHEYNNYMRAVDRCDQMVAYSCFRQRTLKWWKKIFKSVRFPQTSDIPQNILNKFTEPSMETPCWCTLVEHMELTQAIQATDYLY